MNPVVTSVTRALACALALSFAVAVVPLSSAGRRS